MKNLRGFELFSIKCQTIIRPSSGMPLFLCFLCTSVVLVAPGVASAPVKLHLSNNGPGIVGSQITFYAYLENGDPEGLYMYTFEDNYKAEIHKKDVTANLNASVIFAYLEATSRERYDMTVKVYQKRLPFMSWKQIAQGVMSFQLSDYIQGDIIIYEGSSPAEDQLRVPTNVSVNFTFVLHDPEGYFKDYVLGYLWKILPDIAGTNNSIIYNFTEAGDYKVLLTVYAIDPKSVGHSTSRPRYGVFFKMVSAKEPVKVINVTGNTWLPHKDVLNLEVNCSGSDPFRYCVKVFLPNETVENITCSDSDNPVVTSRCSFPIIHYFPEPGDYPVAVYIQNDVSRKQKTVLVHSYDESPKMQLSVIIIPIVCSILAFVIIVVGIACHVYNRKKYMVEVADFDFTSSDVLIERTFFERLRDTILLTWWKKRTKKEKPLIEDTDGSSTCANGDGCTDYIDENYVPV